MEGGLAVTTQDSRRLPRERLDSPTLRVHGTQSLYPHPFSSPFQRMGFGGIRAFSPLNG